ncbi:MAG: DUF4838 domain-containing protein [Planctomycetota bacterium]|nr:DUF4838 domain-containing protein [Planctomycetota bacterium]
MVRALRSPKQTTTALAVLISFCLAFSTSWAQADSTATGPIKLLDNGNSSYSIVLEPTASPSEKTAATEVRTYFKESTGVELPIVEGKPSDDAPMIVLGRGKTASALGVKPTDSQLVEQGYVIRTVAPNLVIAGTAAGGTLHGARRFLEDELGVRWLAPDATNVPKHTDITIKKTDRLVKPGFLWRKTSYTWPGGSAEFLARRGINSGRGGADHNQGVQYSFDGTCHSYFRYVSPGEFFDTHPEYFSEINGKRTRIEAQLCLTNPEVLDIVAERMLKRMKANPHFRQHNFSQMDWYNVCECQKCRAMNAKYKTDGGTQYWFVNELAKRTSKVFPHKLIGTLAYMYTEEPPAGLKMHPNTAVWLCHMFPSCDSHPIDSCPLNADYKRRAQAWSKICRHLYAWHYIVDFAHYYNPFPNFRAMIADFKFYNELGFEGIYAQAMSAGGGGGEFSLLRGYLASELLKDPHRDGQKVIDDFLEGYYGLAAEPIGDYIAMLHDKVEKENIHIHLYTNPAQGYLPDAVLEKADALFDKAEAAVKDNPVLLERVRVARMPLGYARWFPRNGYKIEDGKLIFNKPLGAPAEVYKFSQRMKSHGFRAVREHGGDLKQLVMLSALINMPLPLVTLENEHIRVDVLPFFGGRALRIIDVKSGKCATAYNTTKNLLFPFHGGEDSRIGGLYTFDKCGAMEPAVVLGKSDDSVTLKSKIGLGFELRRTISLCADRPAITIRLETVNPGKKPRLAQMRSHMSLDLGDVEKTRINFTSLSGKKFDVDMNTVIPGLREGRRFYKTDCPNGSWTFNGTDGLELVQRFDNNQVAFTWLYAYPADLDELEVELWAKPVKIPPGGSACLQHEIELRAK